MGPADVTPRLRDARMVRHGSQMSATGVNYRGLAASCKIAEREGCRSGIG
jgi:hypothetical protein